MKLNKRFLLIPVALLLPLLLIGAVEKSDLNTKKISRTVAYYLPIFHLNQLSMDDYVSTNAFHLFIQTLDPSRSYFLQSDIDLFEEGALILDNSLKKGDIHFANHVFDTLLQRMSNRVDYVEVLLEKGFDTSLEESFLLERKDAPWSKNEEEWNEHWRQRIKNEYISRIVSQRVYKDDEGTAPSTNGAPVASTDSLNEATTNGVARIEGEEEEYDEEAEDALLSPEEFIQGAYKQFLLTLSTYDEEMLLQSYLSAFSRVIP